MEITKDDVGMWVWSYNYGWGKIFDHYEDFGTEKFEFRVDFADVRNFYSRDGKSFAGDFIFWDIPQEPPRPKRKVKKEGWVTIHRSEVDEDHRGVYSGVFKHPPKFIKKDEFLGHLEWEEEE